MIPSGRRWRGWGVVAALMIGAALPASAGAFGTVNGFFGQNGEHERITRAALACPAGTPSDGTCFEPVSMAQIAGEPRNLPGLQPGTFGAVGIPDFPPPSKAAAHCDEADYLNPGLYPRVKRYPRRRAVADRFLLACRTELQRRFRQGRDAAGGLLDTQGRLLPGEVDLSVLSCTFLAGISGRAKCDVFDGLGRALHGVQDFYTHSNWSDARVPPAHVTVRNPPGMAMRTLAPLLDLRTAAAPPIPPLLITGCFSVHEKSLSPVDGCASGISRIPRVRHLELNKDEGTIDSVTGAASSPTTSRGRVGDNFANAVRLAIADTRRQWADLRAEIIRLHGPRQGGLIICALTRDLPMRDCEGRRIAIVIDSSGSNTTTDPGNLRLAAAAQFNAGLRSAATVLPGGQPDRSAVIDFDDGARIVSPLGDPGAARFDTIDSSGGTNIAAGVNLAVGELTREPVDLASRRKLGIVVLTDGQDSDQTALVAAIDRAAALGIRVSLGFLSPPANPAGASPRILTQPGEPAARSHQSGGAPPAEVVRAIVASGGVFSTINSATAQRAFVGLVADRGATTVDDPNGADDGGPLASGVGVTAVAAPGGDTDVFSYPATRGRVLTLRVRALSGQPLTVAVRDIGGGNRLISTRTRTDGTATIRSRLRRSRSTEIDVQSRGAGGPYAIDLIEEGRDLLGNNRANRLRCRNVVTYVEGRGGNDRISCGSGADMIVPGPGRDIVAAGRGDDIILVGRRDRHRGVESINGGPGTDVVEFEGGRRRTVRLRTGRAVVRNGAARHRLSGVEFVLFGQKR
jgi:hypothetical protein